MFFCSFSILLTGCMGFTIGAAQGDQILAAVGIGMMVSGLILRNQEIIIAKLDKI